MQSPGFIQALFATRPGTRSTAAPEAGLEANNTSPMLLVSMLIRPAWGKGEGMKWESRLGGEAEAGRQAARVSEGWLEGKEGRACCAWHQGDHGDEDGIGARLGGR